MNEKAKSVLGISKTIQTELSSICGIPDEGLPAKTQLVIPRSLAKGTRSYIERVLNQINGCYEKGWFDAGSVMIRRFVESLIIECFEQHGIADKIKTSNGDFLFLGDLIDKMLSEKTWNLGRNAKTALPKLKSIGDKSAHSRRFIAQKWDVDKVIDDLRVVTQELILLSGLKK
jgi:hypothetical protein